MEGARPTLELALGFLGLQAGSLPVHPPSAVLRVGKAPQMSSRVWWEADHTLSFAVLGPGLCVPSPWTSCPRGSSLCPERS